MKIEIEKIIQKLALSEYAPEYGDKCLQIWVNPARKILQERMAQAARGQDLRTELDEIRQSESAPTPDIQERARLILTELGEIGNASLVWMAQILSQGPEDSRVNVDELTSFVAECDELDPKFYPWILTRAWQMIMDYRTMKKKA